VKARMNAKAEIGRKLWWGFAALAIVWGTTWVAAGRLAGYVPPLRAAAARYLLAAILCLPVILGKRLRWPLGRGLFYVLIVAVNMMVVPLLLLLWGQARLPSATVAVLFSAMPLLILLLTPILGGGEAPRVAMPASIIAVGATVVALGATFSWSQASGAAVVLAAVVSIGASSMVARREFVGLHPVMVTACVLGLAAVILFLTSLAFERGQPGQWNSDALAALAFLACVAGAPAYATYFWLLQHLEAYQVGTMQWIQPLIAIVESALFLRLGLPFRMMAGSLITLVCLILVLRARVEDDHAVSLLGI
jgi:drug/metabolite transporter (DMT)-like permease